MINPDLLNLEYKEVSKKVTGSLSDFKVDIDKKLYVVSGNGIYDSMSDVVIACKDILTTLLGKDDLGLGVVSLKEPYHSTPNSIPVFKCVGAVDIRLGYFVVKTNRVVDENLFQGNTVGYRLNTIVFEPNFVGGKDYSKGVWQESLDSMYQSLVESRDSELNRQEVLNSLFNKMVSDLTPDEFETLRYNLDNFKKFVRGY